MTHAYLYNLIQLKLNKKEEKANQKVVVVVVARRKVQSGEGQEV